VEPELEHLDSRGRAEKPQYHSSSCSKVLPQMLCKPPPVLAQKVVIIGSIMQIMPKTQQDYRFRAWSQSLDLCDLKP
jgi:hypothetical protein